MKYLLKKNKEDKGILCDKVTINGFDYYVSEEEPIKNNWFLHKTNADCSIHLCVHRDWLHVISNNNIDYFLRYCKKIIATTNPNIDIPKVVDEVESILNSLYLKIQSGTYGFRRREDFRELFVIGYNKSQETHPFSEEDMIAFAEWESSSDEAAKFWRENRINLRMEGSGDRYKELLRKLLQLWKEQQPKIVYYE